MLTIIMVIGMGKKKTLEATDVAKNSQTLLTQYPNSKGTNKAFLRKQHFPNRAESPKFPSLESFEGLIYKEYVL